MESCQHPDSAATEQLRQRLHDALAEALCCSPHSPECQRGLQAAWQALLLGYTQPHRAYHTLSHLEAMLQALDQAAAWQQQAQGTPPPPHGNAHAAAWLHAPGGTHAAAAAPASSVIAVFFHDLVYEPQRQDNEEASAQAVREVLSQAGASEQVVEDVVTLVLATKDHQLPASFYPGPGDTATALVGPSSGHSAPPQPHQPHHAPDVSQAPAPLQPQLQPPTSHGAPAGPSPSLCRAACEVFLDADLSVLAAPSQRYREYSRGIRYEYRHFPDQAYRSGRTAVLEKMLARPALYFSPWARALGMEAAARANVSRELEELRAGMELET